MPGSLIGGIPKICGVIKNGCHRYPPTHLNGIILLYRLFGHARRNLEEQRTRQTVAWGSTSLGSAFYVESIFSVQKKEFLSAT